MTEQTRTGVLIVGAGPTGLTLACELARRGVDFRLVDSAAGPFVGSRGKGLQPRTLEIFDDMGIVDQVFACGGPYPRFRIHAGRLSVPAWRISATRPATPDVPYANVWMIPQWRTEALLRARLAELGGEVEFGTELRGFEQTGTGVHATLATQHGAERVHCAFLVGCDGGRSFVRKTLGVRFDGEALAGKPVVVADIEVEGLSREHWHVWPLARGCLLTLCPLPGTASFQLAAPLSKRTSLPELSEDGIRAFVAAAIGGKRVRVTRASWISLYRPHVRMVDRSRVGHVLLAGDAAHVHPPTGGQGLNTGVQDAYNLAWKLAAALAGAPATLLESYEAERLPIAAAVLGLSKRLQQSGSARRGVETQQLGLNYRSGPLARDSRAEPGTLRAGDRAPDAPCEDAAGKPRRLFDTFRGTHWTLLVFGARDAGATRRTLQSWGETLRTVYVVAERRDAGPDALFDAGGHARAAYGVTSEASVLVRPDGYIGLFAAACSGQEIDAYMARVAALPARAPRALSVEPPTTGP